MGDGRLGDWATWTAPASLLTPPFGRCAWGPRSAGGVKRGEASGRRRMDVSGFPFDLSRLLSDAPLFTFRIGRHGLGLPVLCTPGETRVRTNQRGWLHDVGL